MVWNYELSSFGVLCGLNFDIKSGLNFDIKKGIVVFV